MGNKRRKSKIKDNNNYEMNTIRYVPKEKYITKEKIGELHLQGLIDIQDGSNGSL